MKKIYKNILKDVMENWHETSPRWQKVKEILNYSVKIDDILNVWVNFPSKKFSWKYLSSEILWYLSWDLWVQNISQYASLWDRIKDEDWNIYSNYWYLVFRRLLANWMIQYDWALNSLILDKDSRQAFIRYNYDSCQQLFNKDVICTYYQQFFIRDNKLIWISSMRSNDAFYWTTYDAIWFSLVMQSLYLDLKRTYPELELWEMYYNASSMHIYESFFDKAHTIIQEEWTNIKLELKQSLKYQIETNNYNQWYWDILNNITNYKGFIQDNFFINITEEEWNNS